MADEPENLTLVLLREIRAEQAAMREDMKEVRAEQHALASLPVIGMTDSYGENAVSMPRIGVSFREGSLSFFFRALRSTCRPEPLKPVLS